MSTEIETTLARLRALYRAEFRAENRTYGRVDMATEDRVAKRIIASTEDALAGSADALDDLKIIAETFDEIVEQEWRVVDGAAARGYCPFHPGTRVTSRDGKYDAPCARCEQEAYEAEMAEEAAQPKVEFLGQRPYERYRGGTSVYLVTNVASEDEAKAAAPTGDRNDWASPRVTKVEFDPEAQGYRVDVLTPYTD